MSKLLEVFNQQINAVLNECTPSQTPTVCSLISTKEGREKVFELIQKIVVKQKMTIGEAISSIEMEYNINSTDR